MQTNGPSAPSVLDDHYLAFLEEFLGQDLTPLVTAFAAECAQAMTALSQAAENADFDRVRQIAHQMVGASNSLGLRPLAAAFEDAETQFHSQDFLAEDWFQATRQLLESLNQTIASRKC